MAILMNLAMDAMNTMGRKTVNQNTSRTILRLSGLEVHGIYVEEKTLQKRLQKLPFHPLLAIYKIREIAISVLLTKIKYGV